MNSLISLGGYQTNGIDSIDKVRTNDCDGPASINNNFTGRGSIGLPGCRDDRQHLERRYRHRLR